MSDAIPKERASWFVTNTTKQTLKITDIPAIPPLKPGARIDVLEYVKADQINNSIIIRTYTNKGWLVFEDYLHTHDDKSDKTHVIADHPDTFVTGEQLNALVSGISSNADELHTHDDITNEINNLENNIDGVSNNLSTHVGQKRSFHGVTDVNNLTLKSGSINQLSDITSPGEDIEEAVKKKHDKEHNHDHNRLNNIQGGSFKSNQIYHLTEPQHDTLTESENADTLHKHTHDNLEEIHGGDSNDRYHLKQTQHDNLTDGSNADGLHAHDKYTQAEVDELVVEIVEDGQTIYLEDSEEPTEGILLFGKDPETLARPVGITGVENDELKVFSLSKEELLDDILNELIKANMQMSIITGNEIKNRDIGPMLEN